MNFKGKNVRVIITGNAKDEYDLLNATVNTEISRGITKSEHQTLLRAINKKIDLLKSNPEYGIHIPKDRIAEEYILRYDVNNLWKVDLPGFWRMIYSIRGSEVEIIAIILDILNHKEYNKKFKYKK